MIRSIGLQPQAEQIVYLANESLAAAGEFNTPLRDPADTWYESAGIDEIVYGFEGSAAGAANGAKIEESHNGSAVHKDNVLQDDLSATTPGAGIPVQGTLKPKLRYWRFSWTNGAGASTLIGRLSVRRK